MEYKTVVLGSLKLDRRLTEIWFSAQTIINHKQATDSMNNSTQ